MFEREWTWTTPGFLEIRNGSLYISGVSAVDLAREHETPLFVFSEARIRHNIDRLKAVANVIDRPLKICYAAKAMSTMGILRAVRDAGIDIEVNSGGELWKALKAGFTGDQIIFNGTSKEVWELEMAIENEIYAIQVDSLFELSLIEETATRLDKRANVSLRLVPEIESDTHSGLQTALLTSKFGMMPEEAFEAFETYKNSTHLELAGIHLHIGSQNPDPSVYTQALEMLADTLIRLHQITGTAPRHINLGGGFPVDYVRGSRLGFIAGDDLRDPESSYTISELVRGFSIEFATRKMLASSYEPIDALASAWSALKAVARQKGAMHLIERTTLLLEPGRSVIADAGVCLTQVRNKKKRPLSLQKPPHERAKGGVTFGIGPTPEQPSDETWLLTDAGFNILLSMETYKWYYHLISAQRPAKEHDYPYKVAGPLCDGGDVYFDIEGQYRLPPYRLLPGDVKPGEVLALLNCGAYSLAQASQYNGRFLPAVVLVREGGKAELIRTRDSFEDLINNDL